MSLNMVSMSLFPISNFRLPISEPCFVLSALYLVLCLSLFALCSLRFTLHQSAMPSLISQRHQRIDFRGAARRNKASNQRNRDQQQSNPAEREGIGWGNSIKKLGQQPRHCPRGQQSKADAAEREYETLS